MDITEFEKTLLKSFDLMIKEADSLTERSISICAKGDIAIRKQELYERIFPIFLNRLLENYSKENQRCLI